MVTKAYRDYIRGPKWRAKRKEAFAFYGKRCCACGSTKGPIHVHHLSYAHLGNEPLSDLMVLCEKHHKIITRIYRRNRRRGLRRVSVEYVNAYKRKYKRP